MKKKTLTPEEEAECERLIAEANVLLDQARDRRHVRTIPEPVRCKSCGAPVIFLPYAVSGKLAILDAVPNVPKANLAVVDGKVFVDKSDMFDPLPTGDRYLTHWATCADRQAWREKTDAKKETT